MLLAAGHTVQLVDGGDPNIQVVVSAPTDTALEPGQRDRAEREEVGIYGALVNQKTASLMPIAPSLGKNGEIVFKSSQTTTLAGNSKTTAISNANGASGGTIYLLGPQVRLTGNAQVVASGRSGGGTVLVGGGFHGTDAATENANVVVVGAGAAIKADAIQAGNGGNVAVWSNQQTRMYGDISARGGAQGGNGGFVETSSKGYLDFSGAVDLRASKGSAGTLLLESKRYR